MKSILRRLSRLETRLEPIGDPVDGEWARKELLKRLEAVRARIPPEDLLPESGPEAEAGANEFMNGWRIGGKKGVLVAGFSFR